jgi:hypothetical protein
VGCGAQVSRQNGHRNRYGEYVCRACEASGIKFSLRQRIRRLLKRSVPKAIFWFGVLLLTLLLMGALFRYVNSYDPAASFEGVTP